MKAMVVHPAGGRVPPQLGGRRDVEAEEVAVYLSKLRSLLPLSPPKKRKISKLELIQRVIDYICDLQTTLEESMQDSNDSTITNTSTISHLQHQHQAQIQQSEQQSNNSVILQRKPLQQLNAVITTSTSSTESEEAMEEER